MKNIRLIPLASLALAAAQFVACAQDAAPPAAFGVPLEPPKRGQRIEIESEDDGSFAIAQNGFGDVDRNVKRIFAGPAQAAERPLVIATANTDEKSLATLDEDLTIMARILDKSFEREPRDHEQQAMGIHLWALGQGNNRSARNFYIEGHGAIFVRNVNMPLLPPESKTAEPEEKKEAASSSWEQARREVFGDDDGGDRRRGKKERAPRPYDSERVENLKKNIADALKNASHIRGLKDGETVTVVVQGPGDARARGGRAYAPRAGANSGGNVLAFDYVVGQNAGGGPSSILTMRAKKSDIDAFAKGKLEADDFRKKITTAVYQSAAPDENNRLRQ